MDEFLGSASLWLPGVIAMLVLAVAAGFFSACETSFFFLSRDELRTMQSGRPRERRVAVMMRDPERLLTAILFWNLMLSLTYFAVSVVTARRLARHDQDAAAGIVSLVSVASLIVFSEVLPKAFAVTLRRGVAVMVSGLLSLSVRLVDPVIPVLVGLSRLLRRAFWPRLKQEPYLDIGDLERAIETSHMGAELIRHEQQALHNIIELSDMTVEEVMHPRGAYAVWPQDVTIEKLRGRAAQADYIFLRDEGPDDIAAAAPVSVLAILEAGPVAPHAEPVVQIPWCATVGETLEQMRIDLASVAAVVSEYGETIGVVAYEDIIDAVLSPLPSRARRVLGREPVLEVAPGRFHVDGLTTLRHLAQRLDVEYASTAEGLLTVSGLLHEELERLPAEGDEVSWMDWRLRVIEVAPRNRVRVMAYRPEPEAAPSEPPPE